MYGNSYGGSGSGSTGGVGTNPTPAEIYLYDIIEDVRNWINKNKRNNITGRKIKPVMQNWQKELDKVYPHLADKNISNGKVLQATITTINTAIKRVLGKSDSELTFEYLAQYGSPDKSRQIFWGNFDSLFNGMAKDLNVVKKGSSYNKKGGTGPGVFGGMRQEEDKKNRWYGGSSILGGAGAVPDEEDPKNNEKLENLRPLSSPSSSPSSPSGSPSPSSSTSAPMSSKPMGFSAASGDDTEEPVRESGAAGPIMTRDQIAQIDDNEEYQNAFLEITQIASGYLEKVKDLAKEAYVTVLPDTKTAFQEVVAALRSSRKLITNTDQAVVEIDESYANNLAKELTEEIYTVNGKIDNTKLANLLKRPFVISEGTPFNMFGVNINSSSSLDNIIVPIRKGNNNNNNNRGGRNNGGGNNQGSYDKNGQEWNKAKDLCEIIRGVLKERRKLSSDIREGKDTPTGIVQRLASKCANLVNILDSNDRAFNIIRVYSTSPKDFKAMFKKVVDSSDKLNNDSSLSDNEKVELVDDIAETMSDIVTAISDPGEVRAQYSRLEDIVSSGRRYLEIAREIGGNDISAGLIIQYLDGSVLKSSKTARGVIEAYRNFSNDDGPRVKSIIQPSSIRRIVSREMVKILHEMESYWD